MKQYTNSEQTAKLVELGLPKSKTPISYSYPDQSEQQKAYEASLGLDPYLATVDQIEFEYAYSIGELIEMLPEVIYIDDTTFSKVINKTEVFYYSWDLKTYALLICDVQAELIDNLYDMIVQLKEEGVI